MNKQNFENNMQQENILSSNIPSLQPVEENKREDILRQLEPLRITSKTEVEEDKPIILKIEGEDPSVPLFPIRHIHMITAKPKRGKSTLVRFIMGLILLAKKLLGFKSGSDKPDKILLIDTEHSKYGTKQIIEKIAKQTGVPYDIIDEYLYIHHAQSQSRNELMQTLESLLFAWEPKVVVLDGCAQFVKSFNNEEECDEFVLHLRNLSEQYDASVITVLHTTKQPDNDLPKGHLGSFLAQYGYTIVLCDKINGSNAFSFKDYGSRGIPFSDFSFYIDKQGLICDASEMIANIEKEKLQRKEQQKKEKRQKKTDALRDWAILTVNNAGGNIHKKAFLEALSVHLHKQPKSSYNEYKSLCENQVIYETPEKSVKLK